MPTRPNGRDTRMRQSLAMEAARILAASGKRDYYAAKRKAAAHLGAHDTRNMPSNAEIEQALIEYQRIFHADTQPDQLRRLREVALEALDFFAEFSPRLVGPVLNGTADANTPVTLHLFSDTPEAVGLFLMHNRIPYEEGVNRLRFGSENAAVFPSYRFVAGEHRVEVIVFPFDGQRQAPLSPVDGRPMRRANADALRALLQETAGGTAS
ncbi:MAG TPA: hypothetical protein VKA50_04260 [Gammaproteobacteria bacterium]|nr:hypothetical protein [Gammaproteobacteria bacterium]